VHHLLAARIDPTIVRMRRTLRKSGAKATLARMANIGRFLVLAVAILALAACSKNSSSGSGDTSGGGGGGGGDTIAAKSGVNGISVSNCLIEEDFIVQPSDTTVDGTSPNGVTLTLVFYKDEAAAKAAFAKKNPKTSALVETGVVDFKGNPSPYEGAPPAKISPKELKIIKRCIDENKS
jgi:hypothetical protein